MLRSSVSSRQDLRAAFEQRLGLVVLAAEVHRHVVVACGGVGVVVGQKPSVDLQRPFVEWLGLGILALEVEVVREVVVAEGGVGVVVGQQAAVNLQRLLVEGLGSRVPSPVCRGWSPLL